MKRRGYIVQTELRDELNELLPALSERSGIDDLRVQGKDGTGRKTEIPWTRIYSQSRAPSATSGWDLVFFFSAAGDRAYLSLNQATTRWYGVQFVPQPDSDLKARTGWARSLLNTNGPFPAGWTTKIQLDNEVSRLGTAYELGNVVAAEYLLNEIPSDAEIEHDLLQGVDWLGQIYRAADEGLYVPGDSPDKSADAAAYRGVFAAFTIFRLCAVHCRSGLLYFDQSRSTPEVLRWGFSSDGSTGSGVIFSPVL